MSKSLNMNYVNCALLVVVLVLVIMCCCKNTEKFGDWVTKLRRKNADKRRQKRTNQRKQNKADKEKKHKLRMFLKQAAEARSLMAKGFFPQ